MSDAYQLVHRPSGVRVATVRRADRFWAKNVGVLGRTALPVGEGLWLPGVASVHTVGVRFALDLLFLDTDFQAVKLSPQTPPGRWLVRAGGARHTLELGAGTLAKLVPDACVGDRWRLERLPPEMCYTESGTNGSIQGTTPGDFP